MKKEMIVIAAFAGTCLLLCGCGGRQSPARKFKQMAEQTNRTCPTRMSRTVTLDSTAYDEKNNTMSYFYSVTGELDSPAYMDAHYDTFRQALQEAVDNSAEMEEYRRYGARLRYVYASGSNGKQLAEFAFSCSPR